MRKSTSTLLTLLYFTYKWTDRQNYEIQVCASIAALRGKNWQWQRRKWERRNTGNWR